MFFKLLNMVEKCLEGILTVLSHVETVCVDISEPKKRNTGLLVFYSINRFSDFSDTPVPKIYLLLQKSVWAEMLAVGVTSNYFERFVGVRFSI